MIQNAIVYTADGKIFRHVVDAIAKGELKAGARIFESELCERFGVSRTPVRQALSRLLQEGILEKKGGRRGYAIPLLTPEDMEQVFKAREAVEGQIAALACLNATKKEIGWLFQANEKEYRFFEEQEKVEYAAMNEGFHFQLAAMSKNKYLQRFYGQLYWRTQLYIFHLGGFYTAIDKEIVKTGTELSYLEHRHLIEVLQKRDPVEARMAAEAHIRSTLENRIGLRESRSEDEKVQKR